ncbi:hypothetical protein ACFPRL_10205 [Pseudoclavibacter helvolus]
MAGRGPENPRGGPGHVLSVRAGWRAPSASQPSQPQAPCAPSRWHRERC